MNYKSTFIFIILLLGLNAVDLYSENEDNIYLISRGIKYYVTGEYELAEEEFNKVSKSYEHYNKVKEYLKLIDFITKEIEKKYDKADELFKKDRHKNAMSVYRKILEINPNDNKAKKRYKKCFRIRDINSSIEAIKHIKAGDRYYKKGDYFSALIEYNIAQILMPGNKTIRKKFIDTFEKRNTASIQKEVNNRLKKVNKLINENKYLEAEKILDIAINIDPLNKKSQKLLFKIVDAKGDEDPEKILSKYKEKYDKYIKIKNYLRTGKYYYINGNFEKSIKGFKNLLLISSDVPAAKRYLEKINIEQNKIRKSKEKKTRYHLNFSGIEYKAGNLLKSVNHLEHALIIGPEDKDVQEDVKNILKTSKKLKKKCLEVMYKKAEKHYKKKMYDKSLLLYGFIKKVNKNYKDIEKLILKVKKVKQKENLKHDDDYCSAPYIYSLTHPEGKTSKNPNIEIHWKKITDTSGIKGYAYLFNQEPHTIPDEINCDMCITGYRTFLQDSGKKHFHIRAKDNAGNWSKTVHYGFIIESRMEKKSFPDSSEDRKKFAGDEKIQKIIYIHGGEKNMIKRYQHTQTGYLIIIALVIGMLFITYRMAIHGFNWVALSFLIILGVCLMLFATLTVMIEKDILKIRFGIGVIQKKISLKNIKSCHIVKNPWYYGWGIRLTPHGWLYNVSGLYAVEIKMKTGKKYRIGTDVANDLKKAIQQSIEIAGE